VPGDSRGLTGQRLGPAPVGLGARAAGASRGSGAPASADIQREPFNQVFQSISPFSYGAPDGCPKRKPNIGQRCKRRRLHARQGTIWRSRWPNLDGTGRLKSESRRLLAEDDRDSESVSLLAFVLTHQNRLFEAEVAYRRALDLAPNYGLAHQNLGSLLIQMDAPKRHGARSSARGRWHAGV